MNDYHEQQWQAGGPAGPSGSAPYRQSPVPFAKPNGFTTASLVLGILAFVSVFSMTVLPPLIFGSLSILLGILSRGDQKRLHSRALAGVIVSASALAINLGLCAFSFYVVFSDPAVTNQYWDMVNETYEQMLGVSLEELLENYGFDPGQLGIPGSVK